MYVIGNFNKEIDMNKSKWNTYYVGGYTHDVANDQSSAGGVHLHQIRKTTKGWQKRICQSNGNHRSYGEIENLSEIEGLEKFNQIEEGA